MYFNNLDQSKLNNFVLWPKGNLVAQDPLMTLYLHDYSSRCRSFFGTGHFMSCRNVLVKNFFLTHHPGPLWTLLECDILVMYAEDCIKYWWNKNILRPEPRTIASSQSVNLIQTIKLIIRSVAECINAISSFWSFFS